jgi:S1-C subfamily serine protease
MSVIRRHRWLVGLLSGLCGGAVVIAVFVVVLAATGGWPSGKKTVTTVVETTHDRSTPALRSTGLSGQAIYERDADGVVFVNATDAGTTESTEAYLKGEAVQGTSSGSGIEVDGHGTILTNWHVVQNAEKVTVALGEHGKPIAANVIAKDPSHDLAVLRIPTAGRVLHPLVLGNAAKARVGEAVWAIGNPFGYGRTLTGGIVSALDRRIQAPNGATIGDALQTDAPINPGSSGGPLLNGQGEVIGINSQIVTSGHGGNIGIAFAIPIGDAEGDLRTVGRTAAR